MSIYDIKSAKDLLDGNSYVGRGIIVGKTADAKNAVVAYFIMGRSSNSRNRMFNLQNGNLYTKAIDESKLEDPTLIIYRALCEYKNKLIVTNGDHTDTIYNSLKNGATFADALRTRDFEPDAPNLTPRISAIINFIDNDFSYDMSILKSLDEEGSETSRYFFEFKSKPGLGHFIHTYICDGNPIPTFQGEPERIAITNDINDFSNELWNNLDDKNKVALYVRYIDLANGSIKDIIKNNFIGE